MTLNITHSLANLVASYLLISGMVLAAPDHGTEKPKFTEGDAIPEGANHDWTLGATGARGWIYSNKLMTDEAREIMITEVAKGSPSDGVLQVGDVVLGVGGNLFSYDPRIEFGKALTVAETEAAQGELRVTRWRKGNTEEVLVELPVLGTYSATAPFNCPKSKRIFEQGCEALAEEMEDSDYRANPITRSLNAMALLASGEAKYKSLIRREVEWAEDYSAKSMASWYYGYVMTFLAEYKLATGSNSGMKGLRRIALEAANGQSVVGSWGHKFASDDGRLVGYGMMNAPGVPLTTGLVLARAAGVDAPEMDLAIERSLRLMRFYAGKGSIPYGDHDPWIQTHEDNGKNGMAAVLFNLVDEAEKSEYFSRMSLASHGNERDTGHTGNFWNLTWALPGVVQSGPQATGAWMKEFGSWYFDLARGWDGTFRHQGPPQTKADSTNGWDSSGAYLLAYAMPLKELYLTGKRPTKVPQLNAEDAQSVVVDGRGWNNKDRSKIYEKLQTEMLFEGLGSWSPVVRDRSAMALAKRPDEVSVEILINMLHSPNLNSSYGACKALTMLKGRASDAVPALIESLDNEDLWLRVNAAEALASIGGPAMDALPKLLQMLTKGATEEDPRGMEQRYLSFTVFQRMLNNSIEDVDPELLREAIVAGLQNQDGRARSAIGGVYQRLSQEQIRPLLPAIHRAVVEPAPSGIMFASGVRLKGLELLSKNYVKEGLDACVFYLTTQVLWGSEKRIHPILKSLLVYKAHAKSVIPELEKFADTIEKGEEAYPKRLSIEKADVIREVIKEIEASSEYPELISMKSSK